MYSRSYEATDDFHVPDGYSGTAISGDIHTECAECETHEECSAEKGREGGVFSRILPTFKSIFPFAEGGLLRDFKIGKEEILIIATAAFLLFSEEKDPECAILLLLLLFIN